jgi:hypothetical protein
MRSGERISFAIASLRLFIQKAGASPHSAASHQARVIRIQEFVPLIIIIIIICSTELLLFSLLRKSSTLVIMIQWINPSFVLLAFGLFSRNFIPSSEIQIQIQSPSLPKFQNVNNGRLEDEQIILKIHRTSQGKGKLVIWYSEFV